MSCPRNEAIDDKVSNRLAKASATFGRLSKNVWDLEGLSAHTRLKVYNAVVLSTLLYACARHGPCTADMSRNSCWFHLNCLHRLLHIQWWHRVPDTEVLNHAELSSIHTYLCKAQLPWAGHVLRMDDEHLPKCLLFGEHVEGKRSIGGQKKCFKNTLKASLKRLHPLILMYGKPGFRQSLLAKHNASWCSILQEPTNKPYNNEESCTQGQGSMCSARQC